MVTASHNPKDDNGYNALMYAYPDIKILKLLLEHENIDVISPVKDNKNILGLALSLKHYDVAQLIYKHMSERGLN